MNNMHVHGSEVVENIAFQAQVWATVLVASSSGFSRTAAVLSRNVVIAPVLLSHPLEELPNVILEWMNHGIMRRDVNYIL